MTELFNQNYQRSYRVELRARATLVERLIWKYIQKDQLGYRFRRQYGIGPYIADFYCPKLKLVIELDGSAHDSKEAKAYDRARDMYMENLGLIVLRFKNDEVITNLEGVIAQINAQLTRQSPIPPS